MEVLIPLMLAGFLCVPAWYVARKRGTWFGWDYLTILAPIPFWYVLSILGLGPRSLGNFVELFVVGAFIPIAVSCRVFLLDQLSRNAIRSSLAICALSILLPLGLRLAMPTLAE
jgi:hypothetical protein